MRNGTPAPLAAGGLRLALSLLTVLPVRCDRVDRETAREAMALAPVAGLAVGLAAALVTVVAGFLHAGGLLAAALAVAMMALITRGLHLDGLADLADGLGSGRPAGEALTIMKRSDIGPFGVVALVLTLLIQVAALAQAPHRAAAVAIAAVTGRLAVTWACRVAVPAARPDGLGALVAGTVGRGAALAATVAVAAGAAATGLLTGGLRGAAFALLGVSAGLGVAAALLRHAAHRLGGITGDVLGALVETSVTVALIVLALSA